MTWVAGAHEDRRERAAHRPGSAAPVSPLWLYGRKQDLAFEREVGPSVSRRHHVRPWRMPNATYEQRPVWLGGATFDLRAGISHRGLHTTHHIAPDVDEERDTLAADLERAQQVAGTFRVTGVGSGGCAECGGSVRYGWRVAAAGVVAGECGVCGACRGVDAVGGKGQGPVLGRGRMVTRGDRSLEGLERQNCGKTRPPVHPTRYGRRLTTPTNERRIRCVS